MSVVAVLGAGSGGLSTAVRLCLDGHEVRLWNRTQERLQGLLDSGLLRATGVLGEVEAGPALVSVDLARTLEPAEVVVVSLPSPAHGRLFDDLARSPCSLPIVLNPGGTGGALHARAVFASRQRELPPVAELSTLTHVARLGPGGVHVSGAARVVRAACLPGGEEALEWACRLFPAAAPVPDVLFSSLSNINLVLHPPGAILGASWVEASAGRFRFYAEGMTPAVGRVLSSLDRERRLVGSAFGHELPSLVEEMAAVGTVEPGSVHASVVEAISSGAANRSILAPDSTTHRYYIEDVGQALQALLVLAGIARTPLPTAQALFEIGKLVIGDDPPPAKLGEHELGLQNMTLDDLLSLVRQGVCA